MTLKQPEYINCDQTIKVSFKEEEQMGFKGNRRNLIIRWVFIKVVSSLPRETCRRKRGSNLPRSGLPGGKEVTRGVLGDSPSTRSP